jgi:peptidoglycan/xylan/chitin deacetylase (PgdA/CDA1 family)
MIRNFLFHRVNPKRDPLWDPVDPILFEKCIEYISKKYEVMLFEELVQSPKLFSKNKIATIMFDDGYLDNYEYAAPILEKYNCKASFYVVTDCIDKNSLTWTHELEHLFQFTQVEEFNLNFDFLPSTLKVAKLPNKSDRLNYVRKALPFLKSLKHTQRLVFLNHAKSIATDVSFPKLMMNWQQLKDLKNRGHYIASHTVTHAMLGTIEDLEELKYELMMSAERIEHELGYFPCTISYPVGSFNSTVKKLSAELGYTIGLAVKQDVFDPNKEDLFEVSRIDINNEPWWKVKLRISNRLEQIKKIIRYR